MASVEGMDLAVRQEVVQELVVRPRHEVVVTPGNDLGRRGDRREQIAQDRVLFGVAPDETGGLREATEVVGADVVLVDLGLAVARGARLDRVADVGPRRYGRDVVIVWFRCERASRSKVRSRERSFRAWRRCTRHPIGSGP
jgi:hypothetical protein